MSATKQTTTNEQMVGAVVTAVNHLNTSAIRKDTDAMFNALVVEGKKDLSTLPETVFKEYFYPFFKGEVTAATQPGIVAEWIAIAGSAMCEVNVVDAQGKVEFTVPPLFDSSIIESAKRRLGNSFADIYSQYKMHSANLPIVGEKFLADAFEEKIPAILKTSETLSPNQARWQTIFHRYGDALPGEKNEKMTAITQGNDIDYE